MRVISGQARGTKIKTIESNTTRPTLDRVKESLFNILQGKIKNKVILDLFAGSGALGIEALSRGAKKVYFNDNNQLAINVLKQNLEKTRCMQNAIIINKDYKEAIKEIKEELDIVFLDPPYKLDLVTKTVKELLKQNLINKETIIVVETDEIERDTQGLKEIEKIEIIDKRKYGRANLIFVKLHNKME